MNTPAQQGIEAAKQEARKRDSQIRDHAIKSLALGIAVSLGNVTSEALESAEATTSNGVAGGIMVVRGQLEEILKTCDGLLALHKLPASVPDISAKNLQLVD